MVYGKNQFLAFNENESKYFYASSDNISDNVSWTTKSSDYRFADVSFIDNEFIVIAADSSRIAMSNDNMTFSFNQISGLQYRPTIISGGNTKLLAATNPTLYNNVYIGSKTNLTGSWTQKTGLAKGINSIHYF